MQTNIVSKCLLEMVIFYTNLEIKGEGNGEFNNPCHLSVNKAGRLMVCETSNHRVLVFELIGKFVTKFGSKGNKEGEFNTVISITVLSNGRIPVVVSDYLTHCIHICE